VKRGYPESGYQRFPVYLDFGFATPSLRWSYGGRPGMTIRFDFQTAHASFFVMPGLDPGIHPFAKKMDRRIRSGDDERS